MDTLGKVILLTNSEEQYITYNNQSMIESKSLYDRCGSFVSGFTYHGEDTMFEEFIYNYDRCDIKSYLHLRNGDTIAYAKNEFNTLRDTIKTCIFQHSSDSLVYMGFEITVADSNDIAPANLGTFEVPTSTLYLVKNKKGHKTFEYSKEANGIESKTILIYEKDRILRSYSRIFNAKDSSKSRGITTYEYFYCEE